MDKKTRGLLLLGAVVLALLFLLPTLAKDYMPERWLSRPLSLGLDLRGGVYLVYQVETEEAVKGRMLSTAQAIRATLRDKKISATRATAIQSNGVSNIEITLLTDRLLDDAKNTVKSSYPTLQLVQEHKEGEKPVLVYGITEEERSRVARESVSQVVETLRSRVDMFGVSEPLIQQVGTDRVMLQMPGVTDVDSVKKIVGSVAKLEFRLVPSSRGSDSSVKLKSREGADLEVEDTPLMTGEAIDTARTSIINGQPEVVLTLTSEGARTFGRITEENVGHQIAIILDNVVYSSPVVREPIYGGSASISGSFTMEEARQLTLVLRSGALPAPLRILEERTVGPTLGSESIRKGILAIAIGFGAIVIFMVFYYKKSGVVATISLLLNLLFLIAMLSAFGATLTLPGLAGLALTAGMAVDSNVIIYERIKDELNNGAGRDAAVYAGFSKAWSAILDSNATTFLSAVVLYALGTGPIKGFAVSLAIGVLTTVFCAVSVSKLFFDSFELKGKNKPLSI